MDRPIQLSVRYNDDIYFAALRPEEPVDQLLLRSLHHFGIDPQEKRGWRLRPSGDDRADRGLNLKGPVGEQVETGSQLVLEQDVPGNRRMATGSY